MNKFLKSFWLIGALMLCMTVFSSTSFAQEVPYKKKFIITAYYSPLPDQDHYFRGDYKAEIRMNGRGTHGASGRPVYPGMLAAPPEYAFGTKMHIPGVGVAAVWDRGGAIKKADGRRRKYDRLDIWMGRGEDGLRRALAWGVRVVEVEVYGKTGPAENVNLSSFNFSNISKYRVSSKTFAQDVYYKSSGSNVRKLQNILNDLGYLKHDVTGFYGDVTRDAVIQFQLDHGVIQDANDFGAGHFGVGSRGVIDKVMEGTFKKEVMQEDSVAVASIPVTGGSFNRPMKDDEKSDYVRRVQEELKTLGYLRIAPTGYHGETTAHAIFKFQQSVGLIEDSTDIAAGYFGPQTRAELNKIAANRSTTKNLISAKKKSKKQIAKASTSANSS